MGYRGPRLRLTSVCRRNLGLTPTLRQRLPICDMSLVFSFSDVVLTESLASVSLVTHTNMSKPSRIDRLKARFVKRDNASPNSTKVFVYPKPMQVKTVATCQNSTDASPS